MASGYPNSLKYFRKTQAPLRFREDGTFRILHLSDIHEVSPEMDDDENREIPVSCSLETVNVIEKGIELTQPDLVVFGGDNISGYWEEYTYDYLYETIRKIVEPVRKKGIPLAVVFGNHDSEGEEIRPFIRRENHINLYAEYENFRGCYNEEDVTGCGNYSLQILSSDSDKVNWNIWCIDSNDYIRDENHRVIHGKGYGIVHPDQIDWYERKAAKLREENGGKPVPSILFQHIPVNQEFDLFDFSDEKTEGAVEKNGKWLTPKEGAILEGLVREAPCPPDTERSQFESWKKTGDIVAAFFGHDHVNTFVAEIDGIKLIQTLGAGYHTYGKERGGRLIVLHENSTDFDTETFSVERITQADI
ncbi:MAG: metallophosphoesterase family protein [Acutalibacteraceae bacterium]|nr:metallophosphoesterase family protein [Acutalibacteraceae bacterium]